MSEPDLIVDLGRVDYIDSAGWTALLEVRHALKLQMRMVSLRIQPRTQVERSYRRMGMPKLLKRLWDAPSFIEI